LPESDPATETGLSWHVGLGVPPMARWSSLIRT
jgi:hypothetical protein